MKHWHLSFLACLVSLLGHAQPIPAALAVVSEEAPEVNGSLTFQVLVVAQGAGQASYNLHYSVAYVPLTESHGQPYLRHAEPERTGRRHAAHNHNGGV